MTIITKDYSLTTNDAFSLTQRRDVMEKFVFGLDVAIDLTSLNGPCSKLGYLSIETLFPEHNRSMSPLLLANQLNRGFTLEGLKGEENLRRIYQMDRVSLSIRCIPDYEKKLDELQFIFNGAYNRDIKPAVKAIEGLVKSVNSNGVLEWYANE